MNLVRSVGPRKLRQVSKCHITTLKKVSLCHKLSMTPVSMSQVVYVTSVYVTICLCHKCLYVTFSPWHAEYLSQQPILIQTSASRPCNSQYNKNAQSHIQKISNFHQDHILEKIWGLCGMLASLTKFDPNFFNKIVIYI